jgi:phage tail sheath gpL-like
MTAAIVLTGLTATYPNPGVFVELDFAVGPSGPSPGKRNMLFLGNETAAGTAPVNVVYGPDTATTVQTEADVINQFGQGSQLHRMFLRASAVLGTQQPVGMYFLPVSASSGAQAVATFTITTAATSAANLRFWCVDQFVDTTINNGDAAGTIGTNLVNNINSQIRWPITAAGTTLPIVTAKCGGPEGNWIRVQASIQQTSSVVGTAITPTANTNLSGGVTADVNTSALATIAASKFYYIVVNDSDSTNIGRVVTQVNSMAAPLTGIRQRVFAGSADTIANEITLATGQNAARFELESCLGTDLTPMEMAANNAAIYALFENSGSGPGVGRLNFSQFPVNSNDQSYWFVTASRSAASNMLTTVQVTSCLNNGITPIAVLQNNQTQLVKRVTSHSLNGSNQDYRIRDAHRVTVCDFWCDDAASITALNFGGKTLLPDPQQGQPFPPPSATTPALWGAALKDLVVQYGNNAQLKNVPTIIASMITQKEVNPPNRCSNFTPLQVADIAEQWALLCQQVA